MNELMRKISSRKFLLSAAAFIAALCTGAAGVIPADWCVLGMALSAGIYAACEAYVDGKSAGASQTIVNKSVTATSTDKATVAAVIAPEQEKAGE